jgi:hypothetical protein
MSTLFADKISLRAEILAPEKLFEEKSDQIFGFLREMAVEHELVHAEHISGLNNLTLVRLLRISLDLSLEPDCGE